MASPHHAGAWSARAFRALLALYPREFRDEYGREVALVFADRYRDASSVWQRVRLWCEAGAGVLTEAPKEHGSVFLHDLRFALRMAYRSPGFTVAVVLTLALGIGANTAIFQLINAVQLRTLPVRSPNELVEVRIVGGNQGFGINPSRYGQVTRPVWNELRRHQQAFAGAFAWVDRELRVGENSDLRRARGLSVSGEFFSVLGIQPWRGRLLGPADEGVCPGSPAVVSHAYWRRELGGRDLAHGVRLRVDGDPYDVVGITPPEFLGLAVGESFDIALPYCEDVAPQVFDAAVVGRLRPGWTIERASAHVGAISAGIFTATAPPGYSAQYTEQFKSFRLAAYPMSTGVSQLRSQYDRSLVLLLGLTGLVLLIACANLANLILARAVARTREISVRLALGASRTRLIRQLFAESVLVATIGAACGIVLAQALSRALVRALATGGTAPTLSLATDWRMLLFTGAVAFATCLVFGIAPALHGTRVQPAGAIAVGGRAMTARRRFSTDRAMVVTQIAVSVVLLVAAFLFVGSFRNLTTFDPGLRQAGIIVGRFGFDPSVVPPERVSDFRQQLVDELKSIPGILSAATTNHVPLTGGSWGHILDAGPREGWSYFSSVGPDYLSTMGVGIIEGRDLSLRDSATSPKVALVNQTFVRMWTAPGSPIGQTFRTRPEPEYPSTVYEIVGVVPDTKYNSLRGDTPPLAFVPDAQYPPGGPWAAVMIRAEGDPIRAMTGIRDRIRQSHPEIVMEFEDFQSRIRDGLVRERLLAMLSGFFGVVAAVLAVVGLYGMMSYSVARRQREIGIRAALGARRTQVVGMVMGEAAALMGIGLLIGTGAALLAGQSAAALLFGLTPHDPRTLLAACLLLATIAAAASFVPARRAAGLDPLTALREE